MTMALMGAASVYATEGDTDLITAVKQNNHNEVQELLQNPDTNINATNKAGNTALHVAAIQANEQLGDVLLSNGANPNIPNTEGFTPAHFAIKKAAPAFAKRLTQASNLPNYTSKGNSELHLAAKHSTLDVVKAAYHPDALTHANYAGNTPVHLATYNKAHGGEIIRYLASKNANFASVNKEQMLPLQLAVIHNNHAALDAIIDSLDIEVVVSHFNALHAEEYQVIHLAAEHADANMVQHVIGWGGKANAQNIKLNTPAHMAAKNKKHGEAILEVLHAYNAPLTMKNADGKTPMDVAKSTAIQKKLQKLTQ